MFCAKCGKELPEGAGFCPSCGTPTSGGVAAPSAAVSGFDTLTKDQKAQEYWVQRLVAYIIDAVIVYVVLAVLTFIVALPALFSGGVALFGVLFGGVAWVWGIIFVLYFAVMESTSGASIGKRALSLKVVNRVGTNPNFGEAFVRNLSKIYWLLLLLDVIVGLALSHGYQEKYSDHFMGTRVVGGSWRPST
ncbi:MAG TPA: RDD family protein [Nitrososphaerales archaeon]|jgi:uncharacterized RDD family membrane protein YckC|nr:RDD family protein [Nitrososphaerales archaeon]